MDFGDWVAAAIALMGVAVSALFSVLAYRRSGRALRATNEAPHRARARELRDAIRKEIVRATDEVKLFADALDRGKPVDPPTDVLPTASAFLEKHGGRLRERWELTQIQLLIESAHRRWTDQQWLQAQIATYTGHVQDEQGRLHSGSVQSRERASEMLVKFQDRRQEAIAQRAEANRSDLEIVVELRKKAKAYLDRMDEHDRKGTDPE